MLVGDLLLRGDCEAQSSVWIAWRAFHLFEPVLVTCMGLLDKHLLQCAVDTLCLASGVTDTVVLSRSICPIPVRGNDLPCIARWSGYRSLILRV